MKKLLMTSVLLSSFLFASEQPYEFGLSLGATSIKNEDSVKLENATFGLSIQSNYTSVKPRFDIEYTSLKDLDKLFKPSDKRKDVSGLLRASINGIYEFYDDGIHSFMPYILAGAGYERVGDGTKRFDSNPFVQLGGGLKYYVNKSVATRFEAKALQIVGGDKVEKNEIIALLGLSFPFGTFEEPKPDIEDSDGDGVMDALDKCPNTPKGTKVDGSGCKLPEMVNKTVVQKVIEPVPLTFNGEECPVKTDLPDRDRDGVEDSIDQCPNTPCDFSVDKKGCPIKAILRIHFETAKWDIRPESLPKIEKFAEFLLKNRGSLVRIEGHTDSRGSDNYNMVLSKKRAESVRKKLIELGVSASRLTAVGKGEKEPIATNSTPEGMAKNRRIEVHLTYPTELIRGRKQ